MTGKKNTLMVPNWLNPSIGFIQNNRNVVFNFVVQSTIRQEQAESTIIIVWDYIKQLDMCRSLGMKPEAAAPAWSWPPDTKRRGVRSMCVHYIPLCRYVTRAASDRLSTASCSGRPDPSRLHILQYSLMWLLKNWPRPTRLFSSQCAENWDT